MTRFTIEGYFDAEDLDDAFERLGAHFAALGYYVELGDAQPFPGPHFFIVMPEAVEATRGTEAS